MLPIEREIKHQERNPWVSYCVMISVNFPCAAFPCRPLCFL
uniref:Uncharacterized protein n=1 Tax=Anguilla anguilla TaxID=7936 RepID=A0A0E9UC57_ANGAN